MEAQLKVKRTKSEWIVASCGYSAETPRVMVGISVENGTTPHKGKICGLRESDVFCGMETLRYLREVLNTLIPEVDAARVRTQDGAEGESKVLLPQEEFAIVRRATREECKKIVEAVKYHYLNTELPSGIEEVVAEWIAKALDEVAGRI